MNLSFLLAFLVFKIVRYSQKAVIVIIHIKLLLLLTAKIQLYSFRMFRIIETEFVNRKIKTNLLTM